MLCGILPRPMQGRVLSLFAVVVLVTRSGIETRLVAVFVAQKLDLLNQLIFPTAL